MKNPSIPASEIQYHRWGWSRHLFVGEQVSVSVAYGTSGGASSLHFHRRKHNSFLVLSGAVELQDDSGEVVVRLGPGGAYRFDAFLKHRMVFLEDSVLHEVYQAMPYHVIDLDDIVREDLGWEPGGGPGRRLG